MDKKESTNKQNATKWTWYLFLAANCFLLIGIAISWAIMVQLSSSVPLSVWYVPIIVFNLLSVVLASLFFYLETKELVYLKMHVPRKCFYFFISSGVLYIAALLFVFIMTPAVTKISNDPLNMTLPFALMVGVCGFLTLVAMGLYRYSKFRIETALYKRRHGEMLKNQDDALKQKIDLQNLSADELKNKRQEHEDYSSIKTPTSNLVNHVDKEQEN